MKTSQLKKEDFEALLEWFSLDEMEAGEKYEEIREGLIRFFHFKGCADPQILADETVNRVANKLATLDLTKDVKKISIFYGFAFNIYREYLRNVNKNELQLNLNIPIVSDFANNQNGVENNGIYDCLNKCLKNLSDDDKELIIRYYSLEKQAKIKLRKELAETLNMKTNTLHVKVHRLRNRLKNCVIKCLSKKDL